MTDILRLEMNNQDAPERFAAKVYLPNLARVEGVWGPDVSDAADRLTIVHMYVDPDAPRGTGLATRLTKSLVRYALAADARITEVSAYVTIQHSLRIMQGLSACALRIYTNQELPEDAITMQQALTLFDSWEPIPEATYYRNGVATVASLEGVDMSNWEMPVTPISS